MLHHDRERHSGGDSESSAGNLNRPAVWHCVVAALAVAGGIWLRLAFNPILGKRAPFLLFPIVTLVAARFGGWLPGLVATVLTTLGAWFFLTDPPNSFYIADKAEAESLAVYAISATAISLLGGQVHATLLSKTRSEEAARQSESLVRALLDSSAQAILAVNIDGKIVTENAATETMFGYKREELLYQPLDLLISEEVESPHRAHLKRYLANPVERSIGGRARYHSQAQEWSYDSGRGWPESHRFCLGNPRHSFHDGYHPKKSCRGGAAEICLASRQ